MKHIRHLKKPIPLRKYIIRVLRFYLTSKYKYHEFSENAVFYEKIKEIGLNKYNGNVNYG